MSRIKTSIYTPVEPPVPPLSILLERIDPNDADLNIPSLKSFLRKVESYGLTVRVIATRVWVEPTFYLSKSADHAVGETKKEGYEQECVFVTATNLTDFGVTAAWSRPLTEKVKTPATYSAMGDFIPEVLEAEKATFDQGFVGGEKSGHYPEQMFTQITKLTKEIDRCLA